MSRKEVRLPRLLWHRKSCRALRQEHDFHLGHRGCFDQIGLGALDGSLGFLLGALGDSLGVTSGPLGFCSVPPGGP